MKVGVAMEPPPGIAARIDAMERLADLLELAGVFVTGYDVMGCCRPPEITFDFYPAAGVRATRVALKNGYQVVRLSRVYDYGVDGENARPYWAMEVELG